MGEWRRDPIVDRWVVIAPDRAGRPAHFETRTRETGDPCPFCPGNEAETPPEILSWGRAVPDPDGPGWAGRIVPNRYPAFSGSIPPGAGAPGRLERAMLGGGHEIVIEGPDHEPGPGAGSTRLRASLKAARTRLAFWSGVPGIRQVLLFKNHGEAAGATLAHPHLQIVALPRPAPAIEAEREGLRPAGTCGYCRLLQDEAARGERVVDQTGSLSTVTPFASRVPFETWILPQDHAASFLAAPDPLLEELADRLQDLLGRLGRVIGSLAYNWILHTAPVGAGEAEFHWHLEILPRTVHQAGFEWGAGIHLNPVSPEDAARRLVEAGPR